VRHTGKVNQSNRSGPDLDTLFCDECADDLEDRVLAVINSPCMGVCGYYG
jgi:hypothetical protein